MKETKAWGIASLSCGVVGFILFLAPYIAIWISILAIIFHGVQKKHKPTGMATAGLIVGIVGIVLNMFMLGMILLLISLGWSPSFP